MPREADLSIEASAKLDVHRPVHRSHTTRDEGGSLGEVGKALLRNQPREAKGLLRGYADGKMGNQVSTLRDLVSAFSIPLAQM
jgi:hypothetical protein